jgi:hypothetical protein
MGGFSVEEMCKSPKFNRKGTFSRVFAGFVLTGLVAVDKISVPVGGKLREVIHRSLWRFVEKITLPQVCGEIIPAVHSCPQL